MSSQYPPHLWPPKVGDRVRVKGSDLLWIVTGTKGAGEDQEFALEGFAPAGQTGVSDKTKQVRRLDELEYDQS